LIISLLNLGTNQPETTMNEYNEYEEVLDDGMIATFDDDGETFEQDLRLLD